MMKRYIGLACFAAVCICAGCEDLSVDCVLDETKCENGKELKCVDGRWKATEQVCTPGDSQTAAPCEAGQTRCENNLLKTCVDGSWNEGETCGEGLSCIVNECKTPEAGECEEGSSDCESNQVKLCIAGHFHTVLDCSESGQICTKDESSGRASCSVCTEGSTQCKNGNTLQECVEGKWTDTTCEDKTPVCKTLDGKASCQPECQTGETTCEGNSAKVCDDNKWSKQECSDKQFCGIIDENQKMGCRDCMEGEKRCEKDVNGKYIISECINGRPKAISNCSESNHYCDLNALNPECKADCEQEDLRCNNDTVEECDANGQWKTKEETEKCKEDETCFIIDEPEGKKSAVCKQCEPNALIQCVGKQYRQCENYRWTDPADCQLNNGESECKEIAGESKCVQCEPGETKCEAKTLYTCNDSHIWETQECTAKCGKPELEKDDGSERPNICYECETGETKCNGNKLITCQSGFYKDANGNYPSETDCELTDQVCTLNAKENAYECLSECTEHDSRCSESIGEDGKKVSVLETCIKNNKDLHFHFVATVCDDDRVCLGVQSGQNQTTLACVCPPDASRCHDDGTGKLILQNCVNNNWKDAAPPTEDENELKDYLCGINPETGKYDWVKECQHDICADDLSIYRCSAGKYALEACPEEKPFCNNTSTEDATTGACASCKTDDTKCDGNKLIKCETGNWNEGTTCSGSTPYCGTTDNGGSYQCLECEPGKKQCTSQGYRLTCDEEGKFSAENCFSGNNSVCSLNEIQCLPLKEAGKGDICNNDIKGACDANQDKVVCDNGIVSHVDCTELNYNDGKYKDCLTLNNDSYCAYQITYYTHYYVYKSSTEKVCEGHSNTPFALYYNNGNWYYVKRLSGDACEGWIKLD